MFAYAIVALIIFVAVVKVIDIVVKRKSKAYKRKASIEINHRCDETEARADRIGQEIIEAMEEIEHTTWMSPEDKEKFMKRYQELLDDVVNTKSDVAKIRDQYSTEGETVNV